MTMTDSYTMLNYRRRGLCRMGMWTARRGEHDAVVGEKDIDRDSEYENGTGRETHQRKERQRKHQCRMETERQDSITSLYLQYMRIPLDTVRLSSIHAAAKRGRKHKQRTVRESRTLVLSHFYSFLGQLTVAP